MIHAYFRSSWPICREMWQIETTVQLYSARSLPLFGRIPWSSLLPGEGFLMGWKSHVCRLSRTVNYTVCVCVCMFFVLIIGDLWLWRCFAGAEACWLRLQSLATGRAIGATHRSMQRSSVVLPVPLPMLSYAHWSCKRLLFSPLARMNTSLRRCQRRNEGFSVDSEQCLPTFIPRARVLQRKAWRLGMLKKRTASAGGAWFCLEVSTFYLKHGESYQNTRIDYDTC